MEVTADVVSYQGQWQVYLVRLTESGVERSLMHTCTIKQRAEIFARSITSTVSRRRAPREGHDD